MAVDPNLLERANWWFTVSWFGLLIAGGLAAFAAFATVIFLFVQFWSSNIRDRQSDWRTTTLESETAAAKKETARLTAEAALTEQKIAEANARAAEAKLELEKLKAPRVIAPNLVGEMEESLKPFSGTPFDLGVNPGAEPQALVTQIASILKSAGWKWVTNPNATTIDMTFEDGPPGAVMTGFRGLGVEIAFSKAEDWQPAFLALCAELRKAFPESVCHASTNKAVHDNAIHVYVGSKM